MSNSMKFWEKRVRSETFVIWNQFVYAWEVNNDANILNKVDGREK